MPHYQWNIVSSMRQEIIKCSHRILAEAQLSSLVRRMFSALVNGRVVINPVRARGQNLAKIILKSSNSGMTDNEKPTCGAIHIKNSSL